MVRSLGMASCSPLHCQSEVREALCSGQIGWPDRAASALIQTGMEIKSCGLGVGAGLIQRPATRLQLWCHASTITFACTKATGPCGLVQEA